MSDKTTTTKDVLPSFEPREADKAELYVHDLQTPVSSAGAMRRKIEILKPDTVSKVINMPESKEQQTEIRFERADPLHAGTRIFDFLADEVGKEQRPKGNDVVDVGIGADEFEPKK